LFIVGKEEVAAKRGSGRAANLYVYWIEVESLESICGDDVSLIKQKPDLFTYIAGPRESVASQHRITKPSGEAAYVTQLLM